MTRPDHRPRLAVDPSPPTIRRPARPLLPFSIRPYRRLPVQCTVTYNAAPLPGPRHNLESLLYRLASLWRSAHATRGNPLVDRPARIDRTGRLVRSYRIPHQWPTRAPPLVAAGRTPGPPTPPSHMLCYDGRTQVCKQRQISVSTRDYLGDCRGTLSDIHPDSRAKPKKSMDKHERTSN